MTHKIHAGRRSSKSDEDRSHGGRVFAVLPVGHARWHGDFLERSVVLVVEQEVLGLVVGDVDIGVAVAVEIGGGDAHGAALELGDAGLLADIGERAVAVVVKQHVGLRLVIERAGIIVRSVIGAVIGIELHVAADEEIHAAIAVVIEPRRADRPARTFIPAFAVTSSNVPSPLLR